eukprot:gnl/MRDRNA2_/MRDRNA2_94180_c0_seq1.p1 gnl/MRDRNA2_/MRDRNA2_94180_c0~~gnl/MRDRNA2_/MRDRNA2_94180_c0_seq1.p1  ORF type:complete len:167 (-),score=48.27 gnl/MRDRNA2_/MRDRNA2_94180_c0_seq1:62-562(-)
MMRVIFVVLSVSASFLEKTQMDPKSLGNQAHKTGDTMAEDWGQEYGPEQFQWSKARQSHKLDAFDKNLARDATSAFDKKHPLPGAPAGAPGAAPAAGAAGAPMDAGSLGAHGHMDGDTMAEDWGQEYGPKQFQWRKTEPKHGMDKFDKNIVRDGASPAGAPGAPAR